MISAYVFPGLNKPDTPLFKALQSIIDYNGGRLHLANLIENEWAKSYRFKAVKREPMTHYRKWDVKQDSIIIEQYVNHTSLEIAAMIDVTDASVQKRILVLRSLNKIGYKRQP